MVYMQRLILLQETVEHIVDINFNQIILLVNLFIFGSVKSTEN